MGGLMFSNAWGGNIVQVIEWTKYVVIIFAYLC